jgi:hypothetical protein
MIFSFSLRGLKDGVNFAKAGCQPTKFFSGDENLDLAQLPRHVQSGREIPSGIGLDKMKDRGLQLGMRGIGSIAGIRLGILGVEQSEPFRQPFLQQNQVVHIRFFHGRIERIKVTWLETSYSAAQGLFFNIG